MELKQQYCIAKVDRLFEIENVVKHITLRTAGDNISTTIVLANEKEFPKLQQGNRVSCLQLPDGRLAIAKNFGRHQHGC